MTVYKVGECIPLSFIMMMHRKPPTRTTLGFLLGLSFIFVHLQLFIVHGTHEIQQAGNPPSHINFIDNRPMSKYGEFGNEMKQADFEEIVQRLYTPTIVFPPDFLTPSTANLRRIFAQQNCSLNTPITRYEEWDIEALLEKKDISVQKFLEAYVEYANDVILNGRGPRRFCVIRPNHNGIGNTFSGVGIAIHYCILSRRIVLWDYELPIPFQLNFENPGYEWSFRTVLKLLRPRGGPGSTRVYRMKPIAPGDPRFPMGLATEEFVILEDYGRCICFKSDRSDTRLEMLFEQMLLREGYKKALGYLHLLFRPSYAIRQRIERRQLALGGRPDVCVQVRTGRRLSAYRYVGGNSEHARLVGNCLSELRSSLHRDQLRILLLCDSLEACKNYSQIFSETDSQLRSVHSPVNAVHTGFGNDCIEERNYDGYIETMADFFGTWTCELGIYTTGSTFGATASEFHPLPRLATSCTTQKDCNIGAFADAFMDD